MKVILQYFAVLLLVFISTKSFSQIPCMGGKAGAYPCSKIDFLSHLEPKDLKAELHQGNYLNDIWGWTDSLENKEYALVGLTNGVAFVEVTNPVAPRFIGWLPEHNSPQLNSRVVHDDENGAKSIWRDIKVYKNHAFIVSEDDDHGVQVFDLTQLHGAELGTKFGESAHYDGIGSAHNIHINENTGYAYAVGVDASSTNSVCSQGGLHIIDIKNPVNPVYAGCFDADGYTHDVQCVTYMGEDEDYQGREICFASNENEVTIVDVTDKNSTRQIAKVGYANERYTHQGWLTPNHNYFIANDELDEYYGLVSNTRTLIFDVKDLDNPTFINHYSAPTISIDHNLYIDDRYIYQSNYTSGLRLLGYSEVDSGRLTQVAYFDNYPSSNEPVFKGTWSNYPFFNSGAIALTDIENGLFLVAPQAEPYLLNQAKGVISLCPNTVDSLRLEVGGEKAKAIWKAVTLDSDTLILSNTDSLSYSHKILLSYDSLSAKNVQSVFAEITNKDTVNNFIRRSLSTKIRYQDKEELEVAIQKDGTVIRIRNILNISDLSLIYNQEPLLPDSAGNWSIDLSSATQDTTIQFILNQTGACGTTSDTLSYVFEVEQNLVSINDKTRIEKAVLVYPNPAKNHLRIAGTSSSVHILITDVNGRQVLRKVNPIDSVLDISQLSSGLFHIQILSTKGEFIQSSTFIKH